MKDYLRDVKPLDIKHPTIDRRKSFRKKAINFVKANFSKEFVDLKSYLTPISRKQKRHFSSEKIIDLHGYTREQAFLALIRFFDNCQREGVRKALVITGGNNMRETTLRKFFQVWVREKFGNYISSCTCANTWHGGEGAFYVVLKRR